MRMIAVRLSSGALPQQLGLALSVELVQVGEEAPPAHREEAVARAGPPVAVDVGQGEAAEEALRRLVDFMPSGRESPNF